jgi:glycosyltransferase involved in cell wall biosynthesis
LIHLKYHPKLNNMGAPSDSRQGERRDRGWLRSLERRFETLLGGRREANGADVSISLVVPCYNVAHYIDSFLETVVGQSSGLAGLQVILVDDGSTDETPGKAMMWAGRYPKVIEYCHQSNAGVSGARNTGLERATGDWVSFPDPDDLLAEGYLDRVRRHIREQGEGNTAIVACKIVMLHEQTGLTLDDHVLTYRFKNGIVVQSVADLSFVQLQVNSAFYQRKRIVEWGLRFDTQLKPGFEDALFANRYLIRCKREQRAVFAADAVYTYRKRASADSLQDLAGTRPEFWTSQPKGWLALLEDAKRRLGEIPPFVGRVVLYNMKGHLRILLDQAQSARVPADLQAAFGRTLDQVIAKLGEAAIRRGAPAFRHRLQIGLLNRYSFGTMPDIVVYLGKWHDAEHVLDVEWFSASPSSELSVVKRDSQTDPLESGVENCLLLGRNFYYSHRARIRVDDHFRIIDKDGNQVRLRGAGGAKDLLQASVAQLRELPG